jgi:DNA-binding CsgD family transcriptional regulator
VTAFDGVNIVAVDAELERFITQTTPRNMSGGGLITAHNEATCGRAQAVELGERIRPILDRLYPEWRDESPPDMNFEFAQERDASARLRARIASRAEIDVILGSGDSSPKLAGSALHDLVWRAASAQWSTGHHHEAVLAAAKAVNSRLQTKLKRRDISDTQLVREAFSEKSPEPGRPRLRFPMIDDDQTRESMTQGVSAFGAGCFQAIRNPVGHLPNEEHELTEQGALERLAALSLFARWIDQAILAVESAPAGLPRRQWEVLRLRALGHTGKQIASRLSVSERTVKNDSARAAAVLGVSSREELIQWTLSQGLHTVDGG